MCCSQIKQKLIVNFLQLQKSTPAYIKIIYKQMNIKISILYYNYAHYIHTDTARESIIRERILNACIYFASESNMASYL